MEKVLLTSLLVFTFMVPAMAATISTVPEGGYMTYDKTNNTYNTYTGAASTGLLSAAEAYSGSVNANPWYEIEPGYYLPANSYAVEPCPAGKYCAGMTVANNNGPVTFNTVVQGLSGDISAGYFSAGGAYSPTPNNTVGGANGNGTNGCVLSNKKCGLVAAGYYSDGAGTSPTDSSSKIAAGYFCTGGCTSATPNTTIGGTAGNGSNGCVTGQTCGLVSAGYYSSAGGGKTNKGSGMVSGGYFSTGGATVSTPAATGCITGQTCGKVSAGYYSTGGATSATPTAVGNGCLTGKDCGSCSALFAGATSNSGASNYTQCYKSETISCSDVFPIDQVGSVGAVYSSTTTFTPGAADNSSGNVFVETTSPVACRKYLTTKTTLANTCEVENALQCLIRGVDCDEYYTSAQTSDLFIGSGFGNFVVDYTSLNSSGGTGDYMDNGTFEITYYPNRKVVRGVWAQGTAAEASGLSTLTLGAGGCACQIQTVDSLPVVTKWVNATTHDGDCRQSCILTFSDYDLAALTNVDTQSPHFVSGLYGYSCHLGKNSVLLNPNGADSGKIANKNPDANGNVAVQCTLTKSLADVVKYSTVTSISTTDVAKNNHVFLGWADSEDATTLTTDTCQEENENVYYALWAQASCVKGTGVASTSLQRVSDNRPVCSRTCLANYYGTESLSPTTWKGEPNPTVTCSACGTGWSSAAGSTEESNCQRTITLNKNGGAGTATASVTCNKGVECDFGTAGLTQDGHVFTGGWGTSTDCTDSATKFTNPTQDTYYACKTANNIIIKWTGVETAGEGFTAVVGESYAYESEVSYGGDIKTPTAAVSSTGQTFLGWRFVKPAQQ